MSYYFDEKRNRWIIRLYDHNKRRIFETQPEGTKVRDVKRRHRELEEAVEKKRYRRPREIPIFEKVATQWLEAKKANIRQNTYKGYRSHIDVHLVPFMGNVRCDQVDLGLVEKFITHLVDTGTHTNTIHKIKITLGTIMQYASHPMRRFAPENPVPYLENLPKKIKREAPCATAEEIQAIADKMKSQRDKLIVLTLANTGMRAGEVFGLKWKDIDFKAREIRVERTFNNGRFYPPKSAKAKRIIGDLPAELMRELKKWDLASGRRGADALVFPNERNNPINQTNWLRRIWHSAREEAEVRDLTPHSIRHFHGSLLLDQGYDMGYVSDRLGHSGIQITMDIYRHKISKTKPAVADTLSHTFFRKDVAQNGRKQP